MTNTTVTRKRLSIFISCLIAALIFSSCTYRDRVAPIKLPETSPSLVVINGLKISATAYLDANDAADVYGYDIRKAGILPVQLTFQNDGSQAARINPRQTFLIDEQNNAWPVLSLDKTHQRTSKYVDIGETVKGAGKPSLLMGAAGAVAGLAAGIVSGNNIGESMGKGAVLGAAGGAIIGGAEASQKQSRTIRQDLAEKTVKNDPILPGQLGYGTMFFPGNRGSEAETAQRLRLTLSFDGGAEEVVNIYFNGP
ncbi:MAG: hypothetical protein ABFQ82_03255 [Thermodesulfobacteriota bacterium]